MIDDNIMYFKSLEIDHPSRPAGNENSVLREAAGRLDEGMVISLEQDGIVIMTYF